MFRTISMWERLWKWLLQIDYLMGYQRQKYYYNSGSRPESESRGRRRSRSRSDSNEYRRRDRYHRQEREEYGRREERRHRTHSRSRSRERREEESRAEEREQKMRVAIRNNTITYDLAVHEMFNKLPEAKQKELMEQAQSPEKIHECILVRELYVSGLYDAGEQSIRSFFGKYGEIEDVEVIKNFVFVKYFKVEDASNACADYHNINTTLHQTHNNNFKIFFADHLKRFNVVSNNPLYQIKEHLIPVLYASVRNDPQFTNEQYLNSLFSRYGYVRNLEVKRNELPTQRTYVLVEYETLAQAMRAREKMKVQREKLGDRKSEITILIDNDKITRLYPNINNQLRYQRKRQQNTQAGQQATTTPGSSLPPQMDSFSYSNPNPSYNPNQNYGSTQNPSYGSNPNNTAYPESGKNEVDEIWDILNIHAGKKEGEQEEHLESDWCGFFTRNKKYKAEVDFHCIHKEPVELETVLNVAYRGDIEEALGRGDYIFAGRFRAANAGNAEAFEEYVRYFIKKQKAGIIITARYLIYLIPPLQHLNLPYAVQHNELLALFFKLP